MLDDLQNWLRPYPAYLSDYPWIQALVAIIASFILAWIFVRFVITLLKNLAGRTRIEFDDRLIDLLHGPIYTSFILLGLALATIIIGSDGTV